MTKMYRKAIIEYLSSEGPMDTYQIRDYLNSKYRGRRTVGSARTVAQICSSTRNIVSLGLRHVPDYLGGLGGSRRVPSMSRTVTLWEYRGH